MLRLTLALKAVNRFCKSLVAITFMAGVPILLFLLNEKNQTYEEPQIVEVSTLELSSYWYYVTYKIFERDGKGRAIHLPGPDGNPIEAFCEGMSFCKPNAFQDWEGPLPDVNATVFEVWPGYGVLGEIEFITPEGIHRFENTDAAQNAKSYRAGLTTRIGGLLSLMAATVAMLFLSVLVLRLSSPTSRASSQ